MGFFNPFGSSGSGGGSTANYSVQAVTDSSGQVSYKLTNNGTAVGDVISFNGSNMLVNYGGELVILNSAVAGIEQALNKTYNFTTFTELEIDTHSKTLAQITDELLAKNLPQNTIVTGQIYTDALPFSGNGEAEVLVNHPAFWWTCKSLTTAPYSWTALTADQSWGGVIYDWIPSNYELPIASSVTLGGVKVGSSLDIDANGVVSVADGVLETTVTNGNLVVTYRDGDVDTYPLQAQISEITAQDVDDLWESIIPSTSEFISDTYAVSGGYDDGDIGVATQDT